MSPKSCLFTYMLAAAFSAVVYSPTWGADEPTSVEQTVMKLEDDWCEALLKNDVAALNAILADDLTEVAPSGAVGTKSSILNNAKTGKVSVCKNENMKVRVYGNAAVVRGIVTYKDSTSGGEYQFTDTYIKHNGRWQCVANHETPSKK